MFECETIAGPPGIRSNFTIAWHWRTVEQHAFDPNMIVEPLEMPQVGRRHRGVCVQVWCAVARDLQVM
jgi:hypothetical protein